MSEDSTYNVMAAASSPLRYVVDVMILMACMCFSFCYGRRPAPAARRRSNRMTSSCDHHIIAYHGLTLQLPINISLNLISNYAVVLLTLYLVVGYVAVIMKGGVGKNGSTVAGTSILSPVIPFSLVVVPAFIIFQKSETNVYQNHPSLYIMAFGMVAAKVTNRLVVAHMTKSEMEYYDWSLLGPAMLFLNQYFNHALPEYYVLWLCTIWVCVDLVRYCGQICLEICSHLRIHLFRISPAPPAAANETTSESEKSESEDVIPLINNNSIS